MSLIQHITTIAKAFCKKPLCVIVLAALALYANTLFHDYAYDDAVVITDSQYTQKGVQGIPEILTHGGFEGHQETEQCLLVGGRYRPMAQVFFAIEYELFGLNPFVGHLMNVLYYALLCALIFVVLRRLFDNRAPSPYLTLPFVATMVFLVHPLHTEVVANIKGRDEIFAMLGAMGALYFSLNHVTCHRRDGARPVSTGHRITTLVGVFLAFLFGLLSKENTLTFLVVIPLTMYMFLKRPSLSGVEGWSLSGVEGRPYREILAMLLAATVVYLALRYNALGYWLGKPAPADILVNPFYGLTTTERWATILFTWLMYGKLLFVPYPLTHDYHLYHIPVMNVDEVWVWVAIAMVVLLIYAIIRTFRKTPVVAYGLLFFIITFSIVSNVPINTGTPMNERFMFMPLLGFAMIVGYYVQRWAATPSLQGAKKWALPVLLIAVGLTLSGLTIQRNRAWKDSITLFMTDVSTSYRSIRVNAGTGMMLANRAEHLPEGREKQNALEQAKGYLQNALELFPNYAIVWAWMARTDLNLKHYDKAYEAFEQAIRLGGLDRMMAIIVAQLLMEEGEREWAKEFYAMALEFFTEDIARLEIQVNYHMLNQDYATAERVVDELLQHIPNDTWALSIKTELQKQR